MHFIIIDTRRRFLLMDCISGWLCFKLLQYVTNFANVQGMKRVHGNRWRYHTQWTEASIWENRQCTLFTEWFICSGFIGCFSSFIFQVLWSVNGKIIPTRASVYFIQFGHRCESVSRGEISSFLSVKYYLAEKLTKLPGTTFIANCLWLFVFCFRKWKTSCPSSLYIDSE